MNKFSIHFFTIVLNGMPFIKYHIDVFKSLSIPWKWHVIEGVADLKYDTAWGLKEGAFVPKEFHRNGLSVDGTTEYLMFLLEQNRENMLIYRKSNGDFWNGKVEMINAPLVNIKEKCLLWQLDSDELWSKEDIEKTHSLFLSNEKKESAYFYCYYFVGPRKFISSDNVKSTREYDWNRVWRFKPGMKWASHEPPILQNGNRLAGIEAEKVFTRKETFGKGITFQHFAYATLESVSFKESYYGYKGFVNHWKALQRRGRIKIDGKTPWLDSGTKLDDWDERVNGKLLWRS